MFKRLGRWLFWAATGSIAILGIALLVQQSEAFTNCIHDRKNSKEYQPLHEGDGIVSSTIIRARLRLNYVCVWDFTDKNNGAIVALATIALSIFPFTLWRSTNKLWLASQEHADHAERAIESVERSAERQLRAYLFVTESKIMAADVDGTMLNPPQNIHVGTRPVAILTIKNTGQTPAYDVTVFGNNTLTTWPLRPATFPPLPFAGVEISRQSYGPGMYTYKFEIMEMLNDAQVAALTAGNQAIVIYGEIRYRDAFDQDRFVRYRKFTGGPTGIRGMTMTSHEEGNETSEDRRR